MLVHLNYLNYVFIFRYPLPKTIKYGLWNVNKIGTNDQEPVEIKNIKISTTKKNLSLVKTELNVTESRGSLFSELQLHASLPMSPGNAILGLTVTTGA